MPVRQGAMGPARSHRRTPRASQVARAGLDRPPDGPLERTRPHLRSSTDPPTDPSARLLINPDDVEDAVRSAYADSHDHLEGVARGVACARVFDSSQREMTVLEQIRAFIDSPLPLQTPNSWS